MKYDPLKWHLAKVSGDECRLRFSDLERILGCALPKSAHSYQAWWSNKKKGHSQTDAWIDAGWDIGSIDLKGQKVLFVRGAPKSGSQRAELRQPRRAITDTSKKSAPHDWDIETAHDCQLQMKWIPLGRVIIGDDTRLEFPAVESVPGLYRIQIRHGAARQVYTGEAINLRRRFGNYRRPGATQETSLRINKTLKDALNAGAEVGVAITTSAARSMGGSKLITADLSRKAERRLLENFAQVMGHALDIESLDR
jgi:hypothetical protein